jgi:REP element-mobilizing transposase RayT
MSDKFQDTYRIPSARADWWDYGNDAAYFVTICTQGREHYFGEIGHNRFVETQDFASLRMHKHNHPHMNFTEIGEIACRYWTDIPIHFPFVRLDVFVVMPNHVHGIIIIDKKDHDQNVETQNFASLQAQISGNLQYNRFGPQSQNLASIIRGYKSGVKKYATMNSIEFSWQPRFYDHIIRDRNEYEQICQYIKTNLLNWKDDQFNL